MTDRYKVTVGIPLFRSAPFLETILGNIRAIREKDVEVIISDRHCLDDTIDRLADALSGRPNIRFLKATDALDWVGNINLLMRESSGTYFRFLPHDDISPAGSLEAMLAALEADPVPILAYAPTKAIDFEGLPLPEKDEPAPHPAAADISWNADLVLRMIWSGYFNGAFKGVVRMKEVRERELWIRSTLDQILPERCWLFALSLLGRFVFVPDALYIKRFHPGSVHSGWRINGSNYLSVADTMQAYVRDLLDKPELAGYCCADIDTHARLMAAWAGSRDTIPYPTYQPLEAAEAARLRSVTLAARS